MATPSTGSSGPWTLRETALLLNYADQCLRDRKNYKTTIGKRLFDVSRRTTTWGAIEGRLYRALKKFTNKPSGKDFLHSGTSCLDLSQPSDEVKDLLAEMNRQRSYLNLPTLDEATSKSSGIDAASTSDVGTSVSALLMQMTRSKGYLASGRVPHDTITRFKENVPRNDSIRF